MIRSLVKYGIYNKAVSYFICFLIVIGGLFSFFSLGQLEDPTFTIKTAKLYMNVLPAIKKYKILDECSNTSFQIT